MVGKLILLLALASAVVSAQDTEDHLRCINSMFRAVRRFFETTQRIDELRWGDQLDTSPEAGTCEMYRLFYDVTFGKVEADGCSWGQPPQEFESRVLLLLKKTVKTDCDIFGPEQELEAFTQTENNLCTPEDELFTALEQALVCGARVFKANGWFHSRSPEVEVDGRTVDDLCSIYGALSPCMEGLVDRCHNDDGEATEAMLDATAAILTGMSSPTLEGNLAYRRFQDACQGDSAGVFGRARLIDLDWRVDGIPSDEDIVQAFRIGESTPAEKDWEGEDELWARLRAIMEEVYRIRRSSN